MRYMGWLIGLILLTVPAFFTLLRPGIHNMHDNMQYFRIYEMQKCLDDGQIPCRWVPDLGYGFGYPLYLYYSPAPYYLGAIIHQFGVSLTDSVKVLFIMGFLGSAIGMYFLLKTMFKNDVTALFGSLVCIYVPVRAVQVYVRGSLGEFLAMAIFPWCFLFSYKIVKSIGKYNVLGLGISLAGLFLTHNLMTVAFVPVFIVWVIMLLFLEKKWNLARKILLGCLMGIGLSAFYVIPLVFERSYVHLESMTGGYFGYQQHFVSLKQLFLENKWGYGSSQLGNNDDISLSVGVIQWLVAALGLLLAVVNFKRDRKKSLLIFALTAVCLFTLFLMHQRSSFLWSSFSFMKMFQFPWRFLVISTFLLSVLSAFSIDYFKGKTKNLFVLFMIIILLGVYGSNFKPQKRMTVDDISLISGVEYIKQQTTSIFDYLPVSAVLPPNYQAPVLPEIISGKVIIESYVKKSNYQYGVINVNSDSALLRFPIFDFPGMKVADNGVIIPHVNNICSGQEYCFGQISVNLLSGKHNIRVGLEKTVPRLAGDWITIFTFLGIFLMSLKKLWWRNK